MSYQTFMFMTCDISFETFNVKLPKIKKFFQVYLEYFIIFLTFLILQTKKELVY